MKRGVPGLAVLLLALAVPVAQASPEEAREWLERMSEALATRNYDGLFTHTSGSQTETMRIVHRTEKGQSQERLVSLDGSGREIVRTPEEVHAYLPDRRVVLVEPRTDDGSLLKALPTPGPKLDALYNLSMHPGTKLLGREIQVIDIRPRTLTATVTGLAGRRDCHAAALGRRRPCGPADRADSIHATRDEGSHPRQGHRADRGRHGIPVGSHGPQARRAAQLPANAWRPLRMPPGFRLVASRLQVLPGSPMPAQHLIFSDGIAAVSVFIEPGAPTGPRPPETSSMGSANAYSTSVQGHIITAVGEVPPETVRDIASSVAPVREPAAAPPAVLAKP
jgi:sigma-E factor negative regulatory protein RseB